ncbi:hypothetical protein ACFSFZ_15650 [Mixta tenebrionis]|nr:hypothetical protein [Mixta intestinalis]QHM72619.1 hypothetical protein C7M51_02937 [Mixta intestinalis]
MKFYFTCLIFLTDFILAVLPRKPALSHLYAQLLIFSRDLEILNSALMSIRLATHAETLRKKNAHWAAFRYHCRLETHVQALRQEVLYGAAFEISLHMRPHKLLDFCVFHISRQGEILLPVAWMNGWRDGNEEASRQAQAAQEVEWENSEYL